MNEEREETEAMNLCARCFDALVSVYASGFLSSFIVHHSSFIVEKCSGRLNRQHVALNSEPRNDADRHARGQ